MTDRDHLAALPDDMRQALIERLTNPPTTWQDFRAGRAVVVLNAGLPLGRRLIFGRTGVPGWRDGLRWRVTWTRDYDYRAKHTGLFCREKGSPAVHNCGSELELRGYTHAGWWTIWLYCPSCRYHKTRPAETAYERAVKEVADREADRDVAEELEEPRR